MSSTIFCGRRVSVVLAGCVVLLALLAAHTHATPVAKRDIDSLLDGKAKRPFCNAFTGCGKKRSDPELEGAASISELNAVAKHVLAEAKLWEQLQSKMELMRAMATRMDSHPVFRRKRSPAGQQQHTSAHPAASTPEQKQVKAETQ